MSQSNYGIFENVKNVFYVIRTKISIPSARMIRTPIVIRGKKYIDFGKNLTTGGRCRIEVHGDHNGKCLVFGDDVNIGYDVRISCCGRIEIGNDVLMGSHVLIIDNSHGKYSGEGYQDAPSTPPNKRDLNVKPIKIENNVWIGENSVIQKGVTVGFGCIISANSVVTKDVPARNMVAGTPAKIIKQYNPKKKQWDNVI